MFFCEECGEKINEENSEHNGSVIHCPGCSLPIQQAAVKDRGKNGTGWNVLTFETLPETQSTSQPIRVLIVDDSRVIRRIIREMLTEKDGFIIVGEASNGIEALKMVKKVSPDVITMDVIMPGMDGLTALKHIMIKEPKPVVMFSALTREGSRDTFNALNYGAVDFLQKPSSKKQDIDVKRLQISEKIRLAAGIKTDSIRYFRKKQLTESKNTTSENAGFITAIGTAEGGYGVLMKTIPGLSTRLPSAYIVVIHSETEHVKAFANYLDEISEISVKYAENGEVIQNAICYIASGADYLTVSGSDNTYILNVEPSPFPLRRGSANMLMFSLAETLKDKTLAVILTGTGEDGVEGAVEIERSGGEVLVQDPSSCLYKETVLLYLAQSKNDNIASDMGMPEAFNNHFTLMKERNTHV